MTAHYFTQEDFASLSSPVPTVAQDKMLALHSTLRRRMRELNWDLHPNWAHTQPLAYRSAARIGDTGLLTSALALDYLRSREQANLVERMMGRETTLRGGVDIRRHPMIEVRLTHEHLAIELLISPAAWWDQRNLIGKLSIPRHCDALRAIIQRMPGDFRFGFWNGLHLSDMHLTAHQLSRGTILNEWLSTFGDGSDWLRVGIWFEPGDSILETEQIAPELINRIGALYRIYEFAVWTSNNNFQSFYQNSASISNRGIRM
jgi:hypothetical protein